MSTTRRPQSEDGSEVEVQREKAKLFRSIRFLVWMIVAVLAVPTFVFFIMGVEARNQTRAAEAAAASAAEAVRIQTRAAETAAAAAAEAARIQGRMPQAVQKAEAKAPERNVRPSPQVYTGDDLLRSRFGSARERRRDTLLEPSIHAGPPPPPMTEEERIARDERVRRFRQEVDAKRSSLTNAP